MSTRDFFLNPVHPMQKRYEALRASVVEGMSAEGVSEKFGYSTNTVYALRRDFKAGKLGDFFTPLHKGPSKTKPSESQLTQEVIRLRKLNLSVPEIRESIASQGMDISIDLIQEILTSAGFARLFRRTNAERVIYLSKAKSTSERTDVGAFPVSDHLTTSHCGLFFLIPFLIELGIPSLFQNSQLHGTSQIPTLNSLLSILALKIIGNERIRHATELSFDSGLGVFAGLNSIPKSTTLTQYAYSCSHDNIRHMLKNWNQALHEKGLVQGNVINLDFHSIPYWGDEAEHLENNWVPVRGKSIRSVLSFFAQDLETTYLCYSNGDIRKDDQSDEILSFVHFYQEATGGKTPGLLVFDSKLTTLETLTKLAHMNIQFLTLRRRGKKMIEQIDKISNWQIYNLADLKRIHKTPKVHARSYDLPGFGAIRELILTGNGRENPTVMISNSDHYSDKELLITYARRWRIENNIQENVDFFNLNALSSPVVVKVDFDIAMTLIANSLFKFFASQFKYYENSKPKAIFRNFIEGHARISIDHQSVSVTSNRKNTNPMIKRVLSNYQGISIPWWNSRKLFFNFC